MAAYTRDPKVIRDQLVAVLLAGRDTTAATLSWALYELSRNTEIWTRLRSEVLSVVGPDRQPTYEDIKSLKYVSNILNETLRLYPAVPINARFALADSRLPNLNPALPDITVVKGDAIFWPTSLMHLREDLYPAPSPDFAPVNAFSPERWEKWQPVAWQYLPFQGGPRICPGQNFALTEMAYVLIRMAQRFERMEYRGEGVQQVKVEIVGTPAVPVKMAFWEAKI
jgi:cytochrome P450